MTNQEWTQRRGVLILCLTNSCWRIHMKVGFIGTGHMGNPMARNLIAAGQELVVHDAFSQACENLIELGATWADSPKAVAEQCQVVFTSLPGPKQIDEVALGDLGILA